MPLRQHARFTTAFAAVAFTATAAFAQRPGSITHRAPDTTSVIHGTVTDSAGRALDSIEVYVLTSGRSARTDARGRYVITGLIEGPTQLRARRLGLAPVDSSIVLGAHSDLAVDFTMAKRAPSLDTIRVTTSQDDCAPRRFEGFACRRKAGVGVYRDSAQLAALHPETIADMLEGVPGLRREGGDVVATTRWTCIIYLINGHPAMPTERSGYGKTPWVQDVVAVEFYENANTAPAWYKNFTWVNHKYYNSPCSLIVYWTKGAR